MKSTSSAKPSKTSTSLSSSSRLDTDGNFNSLSQDKSSMRDKADTASPTEMEHSHTFKAHHQTPSLITQPENKIIDRCIEIILEKTRNVTENDPLGAVSRSVVEACASIEDLRAEEREEGGYLVINNDQNGRPHIATVTKSNMNEESSEKPISQDQYVVMKSTLSDVLEQLQKHSMQMEKCHTLNISSYLDGSHTASDIQSLNKKLDSILGLLKGPVSSLSPVNAPSVGTADITELPLARFSDIGKAAVRLALKSLPDGDMPQLLQGSQLTTPTSSLASDDSSYFGDEEVISSIFYKRLAEQWKGTHNYGTPHSETISVVSEESEDMDDVQVPCNTPVQKQSRSELGTREGFPKPTRTNYDTLKNIRLCEKKFIAGIVTLVAGMEFLVRLSLPENDDWCTFLLAAVVKLLVLILLSWACAGLYLAFSSVLSSDDE